MRSARVGVKGTDHLRKAALTDFLPTLHTDYQYRRLGEEPFFRTGPLQAKRIIGTQDNYTWNTGLDQPIFRGGALYWSYRLAQLGVDLSKVFLELVRQDLILQVKEAYFTILKAEKIRQVAVQAVQQLESQLKVSRAFYDVGIIPKNDLLQTQVQMAQARQNLTSAEVELAIAKASFNTLLRRDVGMEVRIEDILAYRPMEVPFEECLEKARRSRPELRETELNVKSAEKEVRLARSEYFPSVNLSFNYERVGDDPGVSGSRFEDEDGCPDYDNDKDGVPDTVDECLMEPEVFNGYKDDDGCPDTLVRPSEKDAKALNTKLRAINFKTGSAQLLRESFAALDYIADFLKKYETLRYEIQGHTDSHGSDEYNLVLSAARAGTVRMYLLSKGTPEERLIGIGYGVINGH